MVLRQGKGGVFLSLPREGHLGPREQLTPPPVEPDTGKLGQTFFPKLSGGRRGTKREEALGQVYQSRLLPNLQMGAAGEQLPWCSGTSEPSS